MTGFRGYGKEKFFNNLKKDQICEVYEAADRHTLLLRLSSHLERSADVPYKGRRQQALHRRLLPAPYL